MRIFITTKAGHTMPVDATEDTTVGEIRGAVEPPMRRPLTFAGTVLHDDEILWIYGLPDGAMLQEQRGRWWFAGRKNAKGWLPLHAAAEEGRLEVVQVLLLITANEGIRQKSYLEGLTPLHLAARGCHTSIVELFLRDWPEGAMDSDCSEWTPLDFAVSNSHPSTVACLLSKYPDDGPCDSVSMFLHMPIHTAASQGDHDIVVLLLSKWPDCVRMQMSSKWLPLHFAAQSGHYDVVELLLSRWPDGVHEKTIDVSTALHLAASRGHTDAVRLLLSKWPAAAEERDRGGLTPLQHAKVRRHEAVINLLNT